jgi:hypothetical protein
MRVEGLAICPERAYLASTCRPRPLIWMRFTIETGGPGLVLDGHLEQWSILPRDGAQCRVLFSI